MSDVPGVEVGPRRGAAHAARPAAVSTMRLILVAALLVHVSVARRPQNPHHHHHHYRQRVVDVYNDTAAAATLPAINDNHVIVDAKTGIAYNPYSKHHPGRHVCSKPSNNMKMRQAFCKPTYKKYTQKCNNGQLCSGVRLVYETTYRDVVSTKNTKQVAYGYACCPGWTQIDQRSHGCNKPMCSTPCQNGGSCVKPDVCNCPSGFRGRYCEHDIDECVEMKPCDQICHNAPGSFKCQCKENFQLQPDGQSCRKEGGDETGLEAVDLEYELFDKRLYKLETMMEQTNKALSGKSMNEIFKRLDGLTTDMKYLQNRVNSIENRNVEFVNKLHNFDYKAQQIETVSRSLQDVQRCVFHKKLCV